jgi:hypothetical protein
LKKVTNYFDKSIASEEGQKGMILLKDEDAEIFKMFYDWLYTVWPDEQRDLSLS